ncbi:hypothetical protein HY639_03930 [Candidatus Woesearchaeota archaeon]|nr:hypothetical protein [Candidatus Woesearchaeota archaeon]
MTTLEELASVELPTEGTYKFIVLQVTDGTKTKEVLVGNPYCEYHADIRAEYCSKLPKTLRAQCVGGGRIRVSDKQLYAYGYSGSYGEAPQILVEQLLNTTDKVVRVEMGVGY